MDAAPEVPHPRPTRLPARRTVSAFFVFFFSDSRRLGSIHANAAQFVPNRLQFAPNRLRFAPNRANSDRIRSYQPATDTAETGRKQPKLALNMAEKAKIITLEA